jgi:hypothetical protein
MNRKWHDRLGLFLIAALFLIEIPRYQSTLPDHNAVVALGMGVLLAGGAYYCVETWGMLKRRAGSPPARLGWLARMVIVQIALAPIIMTPPMVAAQRDTTTETILPGAWLVAWTAIVTLAPVMVGGMVAFARSLQYSSSDLRGSRVSQGEGKVEPYEASLRAEVKRMEAIAAQANARADEWEFRVFEAEASLEKTQSSLTKAEARVAEANSRERELTATIHQERARANDLEARVGELEASLTCQYCGQVFDSPQGRASHERACKQRDGVGTVEEVGV